MWWVDHLVARLSCHAIFGRTATNPEDGLGICFAASEHLLQLKAYTYLATHYLDMTKLSMYPNVEVYVGRTRSRGADVRRRHPLLPSYHMVVEQTQDSGGEITTRFTHTLRLGVTPAVGYGRLAANGVKCDQGGTSIDLSIHQPIQKIHF